MLKRFTFIMIIMLFAAGLVTDNTAKANTQVKGTFVGVTYEDVQLDKDLTERRVKDMTIKNNQGRTITLNIDPFANLTVDSRPVKIEAFKLGMEIEAEISQNRVTSLKGKTGTQGGQLDEQGRILFGTLHYVDKNGRYITLKRDTGKLENYFFLRNTQIRNDKGTTNRSALIEGDRVKLQFHRVGTTYMDRIEILNEEKEIESVRKGTIQLLDSVSGKINISNDSKFDNYWWGYSSYYNRNSTYELSKEAQVYFGSKLIDRSQFRYYSKYDAYFITTKEFNKETVEHVIIQRDNEKNLREKITLMNLQQNHFVLQTSGKVLFHEGTVFIRNKRVVDPISISNGDNAFVMADLINGNLYASVVYITN